MEDAVQDIAPAAIVDPVASAPVVLAKPVVTPNEAAPDVVAVKPKGKPGRPRKLATPTAVPANAPKAGRASKQAVVEALPVAAPKVAAPKVVAKSAVRKPVKAASVKAVSAAVLKTRNTITASPRSAAPKQKDYFTMTATPTEMTETIQTAMKDAAAKAKATLEKSQAAFGEMGTFTKGNMEAVVASSKILASGMQEMGKSYVAEGKSAVETMTAEIKDLVSVKSPAEFFEKQSAMMRKQFDAAVATNSKNSEAMLKLVSEAFQPISNRVSLAVEKIKHAA